MNQPPYSSDKDTIEHIEQVRKLMQRCIQELMHRSMVHDASKLQEPEKSAFDRMTPKLKGLTYGSQDYKNALAELKPALDHHYFHNSHHPEHYGENGINGMDLMDLVEMLCDWKAATMRHADGNFTRSMEINQRRFAIGDQLIQILHNTANRFGFYDRT